MVREVLADKSEFVMQTEQLGTGHAALYGRKMNWLVLKVRPLLSLVIHRLSLEKA